MLTEHLIAAGCPNLVTLQEVINSEFAPTAQGQPLASILLLIEAALPNLALISGDFNAGRESNAQDIENPALNVDERIDYIFVALPQESDTCVASVESGRSGSYEITDAKLFAAEPNPFATTCGSPPDAICWALDHSGNQARLTCRP